MSTCASAWAKLLAAGKELSAAQEAFLNNVRPQTEEFAERFRALANGEPEWRHYDELYRTPFV